MNRSASDLSARVMRSTPAMQRYAIHEVLVVLQSVAVDVAGLAGLDNCDRTIIDRVRRSVDGAFDRIDNGVKVAGKGAA